MMTCHAEEIQRSALQRMEVYQFMGTASWLEVGVQVLRHVRWSPECAVAHPRNIKKELPPYIGRGCVTIKPWSTKYIDDGENRSSDQPGTKKKRRLVTIDTMVARLDRLGLTVSILRYENRPQYRKIAVHGMLITEHTPKYLEEVALLQSLKLVKEWMQAQKTELARTIGPIQVYAGSSEVLRGLDSWFQKGDLQLESAAATEIMDQITSLETWWKGGLILMPLILPLEKGPEEMPFVTRELFTALEEFRLAGAGAIAERGTDRVPRIPLTKQETKELLKRRQERDECNILCRLAELGSGSATIITRLRLTRDNVKEALKGLKEDRAAQITLVTILGATRFRIHRGGRTLPTRCGRCRHIQDSFDHLIRCYELTQDYQTGDQSVDFLVKMAREAKLSPPGMSLPFVRDLA